MPWNWPPDFDHTQTYPTEPSNMINNEEYHWLRFWLNACCWCEMTISMGPWMIHWNEGHIIFSRRLEDGGLPAFHSRALKAAPFGLLTLQIIRYLVGKIYNPQVWMENFRKSWRVSMILQANPIHVQSRWKKAIDPARRPNSCWSAEFMWRRCGHWCRWCLTLPAPPTSTDSLWNRHNVAVEHHHF